MVSTQNPCPICASTKNLDLPFVSQQAMVSDGRIVEKSLVRTMCARCGVAPLRDPITEEDLNKLFSNDYELYAHPPGNKEELARQTAYANWIKSVLAGRLKAEHTSLYEVGCGNGSLLSVLANTWPKIELAGIEPSPEAAAYARDHGHNVQTGFFSSTIAKAEHTDIVLSINVIEHVRDPNRFLQDIDMLLKDQGIGVVICPNGDLPSIELLIYDHIHSFTSTALVQLAKNAGLEILAHEEAPSALGPFQAIVFRRKKKEASEHPQKLTFVPSKIDRLHQERTTFLKKWSRLDADLLAKIEDLQPVCFGTGEMAMLFKTYAPKTWSMVKACVVDGGGGTFAGLPVQDYGSFTENPAQAVILAVRPDITGKVARRLRADGHHVITAKA